MRPLHLVFVFYHFIEPKTNLTRKIKSSKLKLVMKISALFKRPLVSRIGFILFSVITLLFLSIIFSGNVYAQEVEDTDTGYTTHSSRNASNVDSDVALNTHNGVQILLIEFLSAISCQLSGIDPANENGECLGVNTKTGKIGFVENGGGAIAVIGSLIDATFVPPTSSAIYIADLKNDFGITKKTYAQVVQPTPSSCLNSSVGVGFCGLEPILPLWKAMRNIVYLLFILIFVVIGIGIMLRVHIDPRTIMTIQNQIPKIIIGILAITFSFAIAGFLIDIMWVAIYLFASVIETATSPGALSAQTVINVTHSNSTFDAAHHAFPGGIIDIASGTSRAFSYVISDAFGTIDTGVINDILTGIVHVLAFIIILIAIIIVLLRLLFMLIIAYLNIILDVIFAPFWILAGLLPGGPLGLSAWIRDLIANLAVFPVTIAFFLLGSFFVNVFSNTTSGFQDALTPPMMGSANPAALGALIGLGFLLMLPNVLNTTKAALKTPKMNFGNLMGPIAAGGGVVGGAPKRFVGGSIDEATRRRLTDTEPHDAFWKRSIRSVRGGR